MEVPAWSGSAESTYRFIDGPLLAITSPGEGGQGALRGLFDTGTDPTLEGSTLMT